MGLLREIFSRPIRGRRGALGDRPLRPAPTRYNLVDQRAFEEAIDANPLDSNVHAVYADWLDEQGLAEEAAFRRDLASWFSGPFAPDPPHEFRTGGRWELETGFGGTHPRSIDPKLLPTEDWPVPDQRHIGMRHPRNRVSWRTYRDMENAIREAWRAGRTRLNNSRPGIPTPYWLQAPPGGATLNGRPYRSGQFVPGTTLFTHGPRPNVRPEPPVPYTPGAAVTQADGTHALPVGPGAAAQIPGAPQSLGGEPMSLPGQGRAPQGPAQGPAQGFSPSGPADAQSPPQGPVSAPQTAQGAAGAFQQPLGPQPLRTPGLSPQDAIAEAQSQVFAWTNYGPLRDAYFAQNAILDPVSGDVRSLVINADQWHSLLPGFDGRNGTAMRHAAAWLSDQLFKEALTNQTGKGNNSVLVMTGAPADDGTEGLLEAAEYPLTLEQPGLDYAGLRDVFDRARAAGMRPEFQYADRPVGEGLRDAVERALAHRLSGRPTQARPLHELISDNLAARRTALEVLFREPDVETSVLDDGGGRRFSRRLIVDRGEASLYLAERLAAEERAAGVALAEARADLIARHRAGEVPADLVTALLGAGWQVRPPLPPPISSPPQVFR